MKRLISAALLVATLATPAAALVTEQNPVTASKASAAPATQGTEQKPLAISKPVNEISFEYTSRDASWYMVPGPRVSFTLDAGAAGKFSGAYIPLDETKD